MQLNETLQASCAHPTTLVLERIRLRLGLTQRDFTNKIQVPITSYERWLRSPHIEPRFTPRQWALLGVTSQMTFDELEEMFMGELLKFSSP